MKVGLIMLTLSVLAILCIFVGEKPDAFIAGGFVIWALTND